jgi:hypothetical protein
MPQVDSDRILQALNALKFRENQDTVANVMLRLIDPELYEQIASIVHTGNLARATDGSWMWKADGFRRQEPVFGPTQWKFGRGLTSQKLNVTASCHKCKQGMAFFSLEALAEGWQHCAKIEHAPEHLAPRWKEQEAWDRREAIELEEQREQQKQDEERARRQFVKEMS